MTSPAERWQMYLRYDTTISREFFRTLDALTRLQNARQRSQPPTVAAAPPRRDQRKRLQPASISNCPILGFGPFRKIARHS